MVTVYFNLLAPAILVNQTSVTSEQTQKAASVMLAPGLQRHTSTVFSAAEILSKVEVGQMGQKYSSEAVNIAEIAASGGLTEEKRQEITKNLMEKHTLECAQLENELRSNEIKIISEVITAYEEKKGKAVAELQVKICGYVSHIILSLLYLPVSTRAVTGQFSGPYSTVGPVKIYSCFCCRNVS